MKPHEIDLSQQTFLPPRFKFREIFPGVRSYHTGVFLGSRQFEILLVDRREAACLKRALVPVNELTDPQKQLKQVSQEKTPPRRRIVGFVHNFDGPRADLKKGKFRQTHRRYEVKPDPEAFTNY